MLSGTELGQALARAITLKGVKQQQVADAFGVRQASVSEWIKTGRIAKRHIDMLLSYFHDVAGPDHWGIASGVTAPTMESSRREEAVESALRLVLSAVCRMSKGHWEMVRQRLDSLSGHPESIDDVIADVLPLFELAAQRKAA